MKSFIELDRTGFEFSRAVSSHEDRVTLWHKGALISLPDFATVLCGWETMEPRWQESVQHTLKLDSTRGPIFSVPTSWKMSHVVKALGAFTSVGEATRNGWGVELPEGVSEHIVRISKVRGVIVTFRPTKSILESGSWEGCGL